MSRHNAIRIWTAKSDEMTMLQIAALDTYSIVMQKPDGYIVFCDSPERLVPKILTTLNESNCDVLGIRTFQHEERRETRAKRTWDESYSFFTSIIQFAFEISNIVRSCKMESHFL